jgi:protein SCO1/2
MNIFQIMKSTKFVKWPLFFGILIIISVGFSACGPEPLDSFDDVQVELTSHRGEVLQFPDAFAGKPVVMGFVYTHCPDICSLVAANVKGVADQVGDEAVYVLVSFDPERDTPEVLANYAAAFNMQDEPFYFLTGDPETVAGFMERMRVRTEISYESTTESGTSVYFMNHSDKIMLLDAKGRLMVEYGGSMTPPAMIVEDFQKL